jgi:hypothetical protein
MKKTMVIALVAAAVAGHGPARVSAQSGSTTIDPLAFGRAIFAAIPPPLVSPSDPPGFFQVKPQEYDPARTHLVQSAWLQGIGCPSGAAVATYPSTSPTGTYTDPACTLGDTSDSGTEGLLLVKTGPTSNNAAALAELHNVKGLTLTELGYDIRKYGSGTHSGPQGSHCGAGAPRFNILTTTNFYFLGCSSPPPDTETAGNGWIRLRWGGTAPLMAFCATCPVFTLQPVSGTVVRIQIVFDEGSDTGLDFLGGAFLDNIDVNGALVGRGATDAS